MSIRYMTACWGVAARYPELTHLDQLILLALADHANDDGQAWPSQGRIAEKTSASRQRVCEHLRTMERLGLVTKIKPANESGVWLIQLNLDALNGPVPDPDSPNGPVPDPDTPLSGSGTPPVRIGDTNHQGTSIKNPHSFAPAPADAEGESRSRKRDLLWEAVLTACQLDPFGAHSRSARGAYNRAVGELRALGVTPEQAIERATAHRQRWPRVSLTPSSLARHWSELVPSVTAGGTSGLSGTAACPCGLPSCPGPSEGFVAVPGAHLRNVPASPPKISPFGALIGLDQFAIGVLPT